MVLHSKMQKPLHQNLMSLGFCGWLLVFVLPSTSAGSAPLFLSEDERVNLFAVVDGFDLFKAMGRK